MMIREIQFVGFAVDGIENVHPHDGGWFEVEEKDGVLTVRAVEAP